MITSVSTPCSQWRRPHQNVFCRSRIKAVAAVESSLVVFQLSGQWVGGGVACFLACWLDCLRRVSSRSLVWQLQGTSAVRIKRRGSELIKRSMLADRCGDKCADYERRPPVYVHAKLGATWVCWRCCAPVHACAWVCASMLSCSLVKLHTNSVPPVPPVPLPRLPACLCALILRPARPPVLSTNYLAPTVRLAPLDDSAAWPCE